MSASNVVLQGQTVTLLCYLNSLVTMQNIQCNLLLKPRSTRKGSLGRAVPPCPSNPDPA